jgi:phosphatidylglycerophosphate synthase
MSKATSGTQTAIWILTDPDQPELKIWGISGAERLRRVLVAAGTAADRIGVGPLAALRAQSGDVLIVRADYVFDERLIRALLDSPAAQNSVLLASAGQPLVVAARVEVQNCKAALALLSGTEAFQTGGSHTGLRSLTPSELVPAYNPALRKSATPYVLPIQPQRIDEIEARLFRASYKGITDVVTKWVWPRPAQAVVRVLARAGVRPNAVTGLSWLLVVLATWLFAAGSFGLGLLAAWLMTFLDTVDGKLARVSLTSSKIGHVLDHGLDLIHPPFWYLAWALGLPSGAVWLGPAIMITLLGYVLGRLLEGVFLLVFKMEIHSWRPIDSFFRTITARRNPNLILLSVATLGGRPDWGLVLVAVWTLCSIAFHSVRLLQACSQRWRGQPLQTWQESETSHTVRLA